VDILAKRLGAPEWQLKDRFKALVSECFVEGAGKVVLMKPMTYMNLSGQAVNAWGAKNGGEPEDLIVVCDDVSLPLGRIRIRERGRAGGQKGLQSIIDCVGSSEVPRLRVGICPAMRGAKKIDDLSAYVLHKWWGVAREIAAEAADLAAEALEALIKEPDFPRVMSRFNAQQIEIEPK
jgi:PTH1 family peptidyl-tRNA hydrolase